MMFLGMRLAGILNTVHGIFYIMLEGADQDGGVWTFRWSILLMLIDSGQVLRSLILTQVGWSGEVAGVAGKFDLVQLLLSVVYQSVPPWAFFMVAGILVLVAILDTAYVAWLFKQGRADTMLPVKLLRVLVTALVTTFFTNVLDFLIFPLRCWAEKDRNHNISALIHGTADKCEPFGVPEIAITIPALVMSVIFICLSLTTTLLAFEINPLSRHPMAACTGRVEFFWTCFKVAGVLLVFLAEHVSGIATAVIFVLLSLFVFWKHVQLMPFHDLRTNMFKGGIYAMMVWASSACLIVSVLPAEQRTEAAQRVLIGIIPVFFLVGAFVVEKARRDVLLRLKQVRREFYASSQMDQQQFAPGLFAGGNLSNGRDGRGRCISLGNMSCESQTSTIYQGAMTSLRASKRTLWQKFFDAEWEQKIAFESGQAAHKAARVLLYQRDEKDIPFVVYIAQRGLLENSGCQELLIFQLMLLRFVCKDAQGAQASEKIAKLQDRKLSPDMKYLLYAVNRCASQAVAGENLGKGSISAINLMEFNSRIDRARKSHQECVTHIKQFWRVLAKAKPARPLSGQNMEEIFGFLENFGNVSESAKHEYEWLLEKYPSSVSVLNAYAHFCDTVLNDWKLAEKHRNKALSLEDDLDGDLGRVESVKGSVKFKGSFDLGEGGGAVFDDGKGGYASSIASSEIEGSRMQVLRYMQTWAPTIMAADLNALMKLHRRVQALLFLLILLSTGGFFLIDQLLFNDVALRNIDLIDKTGLFRAQSISSCFLARTQMINAHKNSTSGVLLVGDTMEALSTNLKQQHKINYEQARGQIKDFYRTEDITVRKIFGQEWVDETHSFWSLMNMFTMRIVLASKATVEELVSPIFTPGVMEEAQQNIAFLYRNTLRYIIPKLEEVVGIYETEVFNFGKLAWTITLVNVSINAILILIISIFVMTRLRFITENMQDKFVCTCVSLHLPRRASRVMYRYYSNVELSLSQLDEEGLQAQGSDNPVEPLDADEKRSFTEQMASPVRRLQTHDQDFDSPPTVGMEDQPCESFELEVPREVVPFTAENLELWKSSHGSSGLPHTNGNHHGPSSEKLTETSEGHRQGDGMDVDDSGVLHRSPVFAEQTEIGHEAKAMPEQAHVNHTSGRNRIGVHIEQRTRSPLGASAEQPQKDPDVCGSSGPDVSTMIPSGASMMFKSVLIDRPQKDSEDDANQKHEADSASDGEYESADSRPHSPRRMRDPEHLAHHHSGNAHEQGCDALTLAAGNAGGSSPSVKGESLKDEGQQLALVAPAEAALPPLQIRQASNFVKDQISSFGSKHGSQMWGHSSGTLASEVLGILRNTSSGSAHGTQYPSSRVNFLERHTSFKASVEVGVDEHIQNEEEESPIGRACILRREEHEMGSGKAAKTAYHWSPLPGMGKKSDIMLLPPKALVGVKELHVAGKWPDSLASIDLKGDQQGPSASDSHQDSVTGLNQWKGEDSDSVQKKSRFQEAKEKLEGGASKDLDVPPSVADDILGAIRKSVRKRMRLVNSPTVFLCVLAVMLGLCLFSVLYPARWIPHLVDMAPVTNNGGRRRFLVRSCAFFARELVLLDGYSHLNRNEIAGALFHYLNELKETDEAIRLGGGRKRITTGQDDISEEHNSIMYSEGCPWRQNTSNCDLPARPGAAAHGLHALANNFFDAIESILARYGPPRDQYADTYVKNLSPEREAEFNTIRFDPERLKYLTEDSNVAFALESFNADVFQGFGMMLQVFYRTTGSILDSVHYEQRLLYAVYMVQVIVVFYFFLFRKTMRAAELEVDRARLFVKLMPTHALQRTDLEILRAFFEHSIHNDPHQFATDEANVGDENSVRSSAIQNAINQMRRMESM